MLFCSEQFLYFFSAVLLAYWSLARRWARVALFVAAGLWVGYSCRGALSALIEDPWSPAPVLDALRRPFKLTDTSLDSLRAEAVPETVVSKLKALKGKEFGTREDFTGELTKVLGEDERGRFQDLVLNDAALWAALAKSWVAAIIASAAAVGVWAGCHRARVWLLVAASFYFYACWNHWLALIVFASTFMDYWVARGMAALSANRWRLLLLLVSLAVNLGLLVYFKYANFFLHSLEQALRVAGAAASMPVLQVILPVGISFYTFEAINYTVDVYRRKIPAERNLLNFMLFITFFPHLVAGPIVRARDFLPQVRRPKRWDWARTQLGVQLFLMGLFKKLAIADRMAMFADPVFFVDPVTLQRHANQYSSYATWAATIAYALQIYCDFSGYSDMALGAAHMLGYKLAQNFNMPYLAVNVSDFWRRWHMSLSGWLRDYLFIPLGGSRGGTWLTARNLLITMTLGGLWHGANWTFVIWGVFHGVLLIGHRFVQRVCKTRPRLDGLFQSAPGTALRVALTFLCVAFGWVLFRATTFQSAASVFHRLLVPHKGLGCPVHDSGLWYTVLVVALCHAAGRSGWWKRAARRLPAPVLGFSYALVLSLVLLFNLDSHKAFIYFQF
jgi:alginate O-acetyltransferase complex protein AlgI